MNALEKYGLAGFTLIFLIVVVLTYVVGDGSQSDLRDVLMTLVGIALGAAWIASIMRKQTAKGHKYE